MLWVPAASVTVIDADPATRVCTEPSSIVPSKNDTVPVAAPAPQPGLCRSSTALYCSARCKLSSRGRHRLRSHWPREPTASLLSTVGIQTLTPALPPCFRSSLPTSASRFYRPEDPAARP